ncbi:purine permease 3 [Phtheirospermum japonicum]|uniref:Purine permease 3 n=1 Tax=Phtheirospermum japonicum TaxID=374723 RepID=A0A830CTH5_9LAMI|nr:purine permease 3 [Phtheirospermum japonicum]
MKRLFIFLRTFILAVGNCGGPLVTRLYFIHGGKRIWFSSWLQTAGWQIILIPLIVSYTSRRRKSAGATLFQMEPRVFVVATGIGTLTGLANYLYSASFARLPVSTSSLILASQLAFTAVFAFFLEKQKFAAYSVNAIVLLTVGVMVLGFHTSNDRPAGESNKEYVVGFVMMVATAVVYRMKKNGREREREKGREKT